MRFFIQALLALLITFGALPTAHAQFGDILEEILGQIPKAPQNTQIHNIPVSLQILQTETETPDLTSQTLLVTVYAPAPSSGAFSKPDTIGQTQLNLTGITFPLDITVSTPATMIETLEFTRIEAKIIDPNGNPVWAARQDGVYRGEAPIVLEMVRAGLLDTETPQNTQFPPREPPISTETINGKVRLNPKSDMFLGATLTLQLIENGLAGGLSTTIAAETALNLDQKKAPFEFTLERAIYDQMEDKSFGLKAWITDWAGRKTHVMPEPVPYNGADIDYELTLDAYQMRPVPLNDRTANPSKIRINGIANFDAYKGLPPGCYLTATLTRAVGASGNTLSTRTIMLDGLSGDVTFNMVTSSTHFDPLIPAPYLDVQINDAQGRILFSAENVPAREGTNVLRLSQRPAY